MSPGTVLEYGNTYFVPLVLVADCVNSTGIVEPDVSGRRRVTDKDVAVL